MTQPNPAPWGLMSLLALFLVSGPWLSLFNFRATIFGLPLILFYLFGVWGACILVSALYRPRA